jgi:hypothetical protein
MNFLKKQVIKKIHPSSLPVLLVDIDAYLYFFKRFQNNDMLIKEDSLEITGMYGERIDRDKILNVELVDKLYL